MPKSTRCAGSSPPPADGATLAVYKPDTLPVWDGMAAAYGRLFIVNQDGSVECWGNGGDERGSSGLQHTR